MVDAQGSESWCRAALALLLQATRLQRSPGAGAPLGPPTASVTAERVGVEEQPSASGRDGPPGSGPGFLYLTG
jgi:hypothetical protein